MKYTNDTHILRYQSAHDIMGRIRDYILTNTDKVNDFTTGSALETLIEAVATEIELYYQLSVTNIKGSIDHAIYSAFNINKLPETVAYGNFIIDFGSPLQTDYQIPSGVTFVSSNPDYDQVYHTIESYEAPMGTQTYEVTGFCMSGGQYGNIPAGVIDTVINLPAADSVTNPSSISTGQDEESLTEVRERFRSLIQALQRGTVQAVQYGAMATDPRVKGAFVDESVGYVRLYCHDANGDLPESLQQKIQRNIVNWRPAGVPVEVLPVHKTVVDVGITLDVPNASMRTKGLLDTVRKQINRYINTRQASQDLVVNNIVTKVMNLGSLGIDNALVNLNVVPDEALSNGSSINTHNSVIYNEHIMNRSNFVPSSDDEFNDYLATNRALLVPKDRSRFNAYVHTPGDYDNPPYLSNNHGDGYLHADVTNDTTDDNNDVDNNLDDTLINPLPSLADGYNMQYQTSIISSVDASAKSAGHLFMYKRASSIASSKAATAGVQQSLSERAKSFLADQMVNSMSTSAEQINAAFDSSSAKSTAYSAINAYYGQSESSVVASINKSVTSSLSASASKADTSYNSSSASQLASSLASNYMSLANASNSASYTNPTNSSAVTVQGPAAVSAGDASGNHTLRVTNRYLTRGDEILRAGNIVVDYDKINKLR